MKKSFKLLFVGRPTLNKGILDLIKALEMLDIYNWTLTIVGDYNGGMSELMNYYSLFDERKIKIVGAVDNCNLNKFYNDHDIVVVPSHYENFGHVALEAMATGCPTIVSRVGGLKWLIEHGITGLLFTPKDTVDLAEKLEFAFLNFPLMQEMGQRGKKEANKYDWNNITIKTEALFLEFII